MNQVVTPRVSPLQLFKEVG